MVVGPLPLKAGPGLRPVGCVHGRPGWGGGAAGARTEEQEGARVQVAWLWARGAQV